VDQSFASVFGITNEEFDQIQEVVQQIFLSDEVESNFDFIRKIKETCKNEDINKQHFYMFCAGSVHTQNVIE